MPENSSVPQKQSPFPDRIWEFFISLRLAIVLLLFLSLLSVAGTLIPQNRPPQEYGRLFRPETVDLMARVGLLDMYHSWWFISCLTLLALSLIACTLERCPLIVASLKKRGALLDAKLEAELKNPFKIRYSLPLETVEKRITALMGKAFPAAPVVTETERGRHYFYEKGKYTRLSFFLIHVSILIIFIGVLIGSIFGFKGYVNVNEGETISALQIGQGQSKTLDFGLRCNSFAVDFYGSGAPKDYRSDLSILKDGKEIVRKTIRVNDPLTYGGITFYQASYGALPRQVTFEIRDRQGAPLGAVVAPFGEQVDLPFGGAKIQVVDYLEHFPLRAGSGAGRLVRVNLYGFGTAPEGLWLFQDRHEMNRYGDYAFAVKDIRMGKFTGLQVNKDPGVWLVWIGSLLLVGGIMTAFFLSHRRFWIRIEKEGEDRIEVTAGGITNKNKSAFAAETAALVQRFREASS